MLEGLSPRREHVEVRIRKRPRKLLPELALRGKVLPFLRCEAYGSFRTKTRMALLRYSFYNEI